MQHATNAYSLDHSNGFKQHHTAGARRALDLVGHTVVPVAGSERASHSNAPASGVVTGIHFSDLDHPYVIVAFPSSVELMFAHDLEALPEPALSEAPDAQGNYASSNPISHGETPLSDGPARPAVPDLRPHLEWALLRIKTSLSTDERHRAAHHALVTAYVAPEGGPDLRPHLRWVLRRIAISLDTGDRYDAALAALEAADAAAGACDA